ncbi:MAG: hypothetical protein AMJ89_00230 [candidate division Zixibacteria bacterium SM23_73]|nr:MAG: hypothetical protein AMJ89_00230 [candidate division Zixibacteria bacterium SM23_73]
MRKNNFILFIAILFILVGLGCLWTVKLIENGSEKEPEVKTKGIMILIEYKDMIGLGNFVNEMHKRGVWGLLMVTPEFVSTNCSEIKELLKYNIEIVGSNVGAAFWDVPYEEQKERIIEMKQEIESCTGVPLRIISSRYMASDITTLKVAEELGIPYVTARGTTDTKATVYQVEGYNTKILSVSNIPKVQFKYGSLCDYSYFERAGTPDDMMQELTRAIEPLTSKEKARYGTSQKITPVSHTNIGGYLKPWMEMWVEFWDTTKDKIEWTNLDKFMEDSDWILPEWQVPINKNAPYTPEKIRPLIPYEEEEKINNPCAAQNIGKPESEWEEEADVGDKIMMFHNGQGPMCLEALEFISAIDYPVEQFLDYEQGFREELDKLIAEFGKSEGVSESFGYYPIIFIKDRVFSGFNQEIESKILEEIAK